MPLDTKQHKWLPLGLNSQACLQNTTTICPGTPFPKLSRVFAADNHQFQSPFQALLSKQVSCVNGLFNCVTAPDEPLISPQKRFLIFDQSGNQTRMLQCGFPLRFPPSMATEPDKLLNKDHPVPKKILLNENGQKEESDMHEDTEEINALLYSDSDDDCESDDDDEVMSTGQSPFIVEFQACNKTTDETDGPRHKRQKLLDHSSPSFVVTTELLPESNITSEDDMSRKEKINTAMRILESVVPGAKGKEALVLLDEAIDYLKLLKRNYLNLY